MSTVLNGSRAWATRSSSSSAPLVEGVEVDDGVALEVGIVGGERGMGGGGSRRRCRRTALRRCGRRTRSSGRAPGHHRLDRRTPRRALGRRWLPARAPMSPMGTGVAGDDPARLPHDQRPGRVDHGCHRRRRGCASPWGGCAARGGREEVLGEVENRRLHHPPRRSTVPSVTRPRGSFGRPQSAVPALVTMGLARRRNSGASPNTAAAWRSGTRSRRWRRSASAWAWRAWAPAVDIFPRSRAFSASSSIPGGGPLRFPPQGRDLRGTGQRISMASE